MPKLFDLGQSELEEAAFDPWEGWPYDHTWEDVKWFLIYFGILLIICLIASCKDNFKQPAFTRSYTDEQIVKAIYKAEGVATYGIKSVSCHTQVQCHDIALNTVRHTRRRFELSGQRGPDDFIRFLQKRYCPDKEGSCQAWYSNVTYFLKKDNP